MNWKCLISVPRNLGYQNTRIILRTVRTVLGVRFSVSKQIFMYCEVNTTDTQFPLLHISALGGSLPENNPYINTSSAFDSVRCIKHRHIPVSIKTSHRKMLKQSIESFLSSTGGSVNVQRRQLITKIRIESWQDEHMCTRRLWPSTDPPVKVLYPLTRYKLGFYSFRLTIYCF
jgi:hypothetical protein